MKERWRISIGWRAVLSAGILLILVAWMGYAQRIASASNAEDLRIAARLGDLRQVGRLLALGVCVDARDEVDETPLMEAARAGQLDMCRFLLAHGATLDARAHACGTALMQATQQDHVEVMQFLLKQGADPNLGSDTNGSPLLMATMANDPRLVDLLLDAGAIPDQRAQFQEFADEQCRITRQL